MANNDEAEDTVVEVPGVGMVAFPAGMSEAEISDVIQNQILAGREQAPSPQPRQEQPRAPQAMPQGDMPTLPVSAGQWGMAPGPIASLSQGIAGAATGAGRIPEGSEDMGSFQANDASTMQQIELAAGFLMSNDTQQRIDMVRDVLGEDAQIEQDEAGNTIVRFGDETAFLNRPGFDQRDALTLVGEIVQFAPAAKVANWLGRAAGWAARIFGGAGAAGTTEAVRQGGATAVGAEDFSASNVALTTVFGGAGEFGIGMLQRFKPEARDAIRRVRDVYGIDLRGTPHSQVEDTARYASTHVPSRPGVTQGRPVYERGTPYDDMQVELQAQRRIERTQAAERFREARAYNMAIFRPTEVSRMRTELLEQMDIEGLDVRDIGTAGRRYLDDLAEMADSEGGINISALERWRRQVSSARRNAEQAFEKSGQRGEEAVALGRMVDRYDDWMQQQYIDDMISGDPRAVEMWRTARTEWRRVMDRFDDDELVRKLVFERNATPEQMREWLFGVASTQSPARAGETVRRLNTIFGRDSEIMGRVQADFMLDIIDPLLRDQPNLPAFIQNFDDLIQNRPTLVRQLFTPEEIRNWEELAAYVRGIRLRPGTDITMMPQDFMSKVSAFAVRMTIGHGIAKGGARVSLGRGILDRLRVGSAGRLGRRQILEEVLGVYPLQPLVPHGTGTVLGSMEAQRWLQGGEDTRTPDQ